MVSLEGNQPRRRTTLRNTLVGKLEMVSERKVQTPKKSLVRVSKGIQL